MVDLSAKGLKREAIGVFMAFDDKFICLPASIGWIRLRGDPYSFNLGTGEVGREGFRSWEEQTFYEVEGFGGSVEGLIYSELDDVQK